MTATGWTEGPDGAPAVSGGFAGFLAGMRPGPEDRLDPLARARLAPDRRDPEPYDADETAANLLAAGLAPGQVTDLARRHREAVTGAQDEREKIAKGEKVTARVRGMLERGQIGALEASAMMDGDFGDVHRAEQLERRAESLARQLAGAQALIAPKRQPGADPYEEAGRRAHQVFAELTRARTEAARAGRREPPPFACRTCRTCGGAAVRRSEVTCPECLKLGVDAETSFLIDSDPAPEECPSPPGPCTCFEAAGLPEPAGDREAGRGDMQVVQTGKGTWSYDRRRDEISRLAVR